MLKEYLEDRGLSAVQTREPGGTQPGEEIRQVLLNPDRSKLLYPETQALLFYAARTEFLRDVVKPNLEQGVTVVTDRFDASTYVYQGYTQGVSGQLLDVLYRHIVIGSECKPDFYVILDITAEESYLREANADNQGQDLVYERQGLEFRRKLCEGYREYARGYVTFAMMGDASYAYTDATLIDGMRNKDIIHREIVEMVDARLKLREIIDKE